MTEPQTLIMTEDECLEEMFVVLGAVLKAVRASSLEMVGLLRIRLYWCPGGQCWRHCGFQRNKYKVDCWRNNLLFCRTEAVGRSKSS